MKSLLKFTLLAALIIGGKLAKQSVPVVVAPTVAAKPVAPVAIPGTPAILVHQVLTSEPVQPAKEQAQPQQGSSGLITEMF